MMIDCDSCTVRGAACTDCVVTFLTIPVRPSAGRPDAIPVRPSAGHPDASAGGGDGQPADVGSTSAGAVAAPGGRAVPRADPGTGSPPVRVDLDDAERAAIDVLALSGLVPPLRMVRAM